MYCNHGRPQTLARGALALPWNIYKIDSVTTFCFGQKVPNSLPQDTFMAQNIRKLLPQIPSCIKAIRFTTEKRGQSGKSRREGEGREEKNGETGEGMDFTFVLQ